MDIVLFDNTAESALRLAAFFGTSPQFWLGLQNDYDLEEERNRIEKELVQIQKGLKIRLVTT